MPSSLLQVVNHLFQTCYNLQLLGTSSANTTCRQLVNRFVTTCLQTCNNLCVLTCVRSKRFQFCIEVHFMTPYNKNRYLLFLFLDKFTFSCVLSTSFPWQVYFLVCTDVNKFSLTSLLFRVYSQQVFFDKFTFSCVQSTSFPWQVLLLVYMEMNVVKHISHVKADFCLSNNGR
jgi:hypothetical protein